MVDDFEIIIMNVRGSHPCAYINVPKKILDKYKNPVLDYDAWYASVHGGFTWASHESPSIQYGHPGFWLGWDYAHCGDYTCMVLDGIPINPPRQNEHVWTTEEIYEEALEVIKTLEYDTEWE